MTTDESIPRLVFVGGFLGAGKTSLILKATDILQRLGSRVAVIMNDQDQGLVDTRHALNQGLRTQEVAGGCFCCRFSDLVDAAAEFTDYDPHVIFAEPVGSCVDLSATILQPLLAFHRQQYHLSPLTVLVDPAFAAQSQRGEMDPDMEFLFRNQIAEADLLCLTKQDLCPTPLPLPWPVDFQLSAQTGLGVDQWLEEVLHPTRVAGARLLEVDYQRYAAAEAALGWLNVHCDLVFTKPLSPPLVAGPMLDQLCHELTASRIQIAHLKIFDRADAGWIKVAVTANHGDPQPEGDLLAEPAHRHQIAINLRALGDPASLEEIVRRVLKSFDGQLHIGHLGAFRPAAPVPQHRFVKTTNDDHPRA